MDEARATDVLDAHRFKLRSESERAYRLKWEAWEWLYHEARCRCIGLEVRLQGPWGSVVDVVGIGPSNTIYVVEVKASRADFARDNHTEADIDRLRQRAGCAGPSDPIGPVRRAIGPRTARTSGWNRKRNGCASG